MKLTLTYVNRTERQSRDGKPYTSISIKAHEYGDKYLSGFGNKANEGWKVGDSVEIAEVKEVAKDGKTYLNFEMPKTDRAASPEIIKLFSEIATKLGKLDLKVTQIHDHLSGKSKFGFTSAGTKVPDFSEVDIRPEDVSF